jgi:hypothetical protein
VKHNGGPLIQDVIVPCGIVEQLKLVQSLLGHRFSLRPRKQRSDPVTHPGHTGLGRAVRATEDLPIGFHAVPNDSAPTMGTAGGEGVNGALERVKDVRLFALQDLNRFVVVVAADFAHVFHGINLLLLSVTRV